jgi:hypothetical protein
MTMTQVQKRLTKLEQTVNRLVHELDYRESVQAIREGLESADRGEGGSAKKVFARLHRKYKVARSR